MRWCMARAFRIKELSAMKTVAILEGIQDFAVSQDDSEVVLV